MRHRKMGWSGQLNVQSLHSHPGTGDTAVDASWTAAEATAAEAAVVIAPLWLRSCCLAVATAWHDV